MTKKFDLFLSYARSDDDPDYSDPAKSLLRRLYIDLTATGYTVWWDRESMPSRALTFLQEIRDAIAESSRLVVVVGPSALESVYVKAEWEYALSICLPVIPILRAGDYSLVPPALKDLHTADFRVSRSYADALAELKRILAEPAAPLGRLHAVPSLPQWYIRRGKDLDALAHTVCADAHQPVVITSKKQTVALQGMGGIGKTVLASALCHECNIRRSFPDGVFWIEIGQEPQIATRLGDIGHAFGDDRGEYPDELRGRSRLTALLEDKAVLVVLDDVWDSRHAEAFRVVGPRGRLVITTRSRRLVTQLGALNQSIDILTDDEGRALIAERLGIAPADLSLECINIIRLLGGHTLAITIAAAQLCERGMDFASRLLERLHRRADEGNPFKDLDMSDDDKNQNLELCLSLSYDDLSDGLKRRFRLIGVFATNGTFDQAAVAAVWGDDDEDDADDALNDLVRAGLLVLENGRYNQHGLLRVYARALLRRAGELDDAQRRHFDHYSTLYGDYDANNNEGRHSAIQSDFEDLRAALAWGWNHASQSAVDLAFALTYYMQLRESHETARFLLTTAHQAAERSGYTKGQAHVLRALGDVELREDDCAAARSCFSQALALYSLSGTVFGQANTLQALGNAAMRELQFADAMNYYGLALTLYEQIPDPLGQANTLVGLGEVVRTKGEHIVALGYYRRALTLFERLGDRQGQAKSLFFMGEVARMVYDYTDAQDYYEQALTLFKQTHDQVAQANILGALGDVAYMQDDLTAAQTYYNDARTIYHQIPVQLGEANMLHSLGEVARMRLEYSVAQECYSQALTIFEQRREPRGQANSITGMADLARMQGNYLAASTLYHRAMGFYERIADQRGQARVQKLLGDVATAVNRYEEAQSYYDSACTLFQQVSDQLGEAQALQALGDVELIRKGYAAAQGHYDRALIIYEQIEDLTGRLNICYRLARLATALNNTSAACQYYQELFAIANAHPFFRDHPVTKNWRAEYVQLGCKG